VVNTAARDQLDPGSPIRIGVPDHLVPLIVTGVVRDGIDEPRVYVEISEYFRFAPVDGSIAVELHAPKLPQDAVKASIRQMTALGAPIELLETHRTDRLGGLAAEVGTTTQVLLILAVLSLASTVVGILNVGLSTAKARAREFTLRRTMGASRAHVAVIVMTESQILAVGAALVAFGGSFLLFPVVIGAFGSQLGIAPPVYDPAYGLICLVVASLAAAASSIVPALLSYRRDLSSVMRE
jgi:putative ABC transport system permease protein